MAEAKVQPLLPVTDPSLPTTRTPRSPAAAAALDPVPEQGAALPPAKAPEGEHGEARQPAQEHPPG